MSRGTEYADALARDIGQEAFYKINPNILGPQYSLPKMLWLRDHEPEVFARADYFLFWADLVPLCWGASPMAANSLANRSLLFDLKKNDWSDELLAWSDMEPERLGRIVPGGTVIGTVVERVAAELGLPARRAGRLGRARPVLQRARRRLHRARKARSAASALSNASRRLTARSGNPCGCSSCG